MLRQRLEWEGFSAPSPLNEFPDFPNIIFRHVDDSPRVGAPGEIVYPIIAQVVPDMNNKYVIKFRDTEPITWPGAWQMYRALVAWSFCGGEIVIHPRAEGIRVVGISRGRPRFVVGTGISIFVQQVVGPVPDDVRFGPVVTQNMVVVLACEVPDLDSASLTYHLLPAEYVSDPPLPKFLCGGSPSVLAYWLPPPPVFSQDSPHWGNIRYRYARVQAGISAGEWAEGGRVVAGGERSFNGVAERGLPYLLLHGLAL